MNSLGWNGILVKHLVQLYGVVNMAHKDDDLVELELINQVHQLCDLLTLFKADIVLAQAMQGELAFLLDEDLGRVAHELAACDLDLIREGSGKHHNLLAVRGALKDLLDIVAHI